MIIKILSVILIQLLSHQAWAFCLQSFNAYGPVYAPAISTRTELMIEDLKKQDCDFVQLQEVWNSGQIHQVKNAFLDKEVYSPNEQSKIGIMGIYNSDLLKTEFHFFRVNTDNGFLDQIRKLFSVRKAFSVVETLNPENFEPIFLINAHLHPQSQKVRLAQILDFLIWRMNHPDRKVVLSGDFNFSPESFERYFLMYLLGAHDAYETIYRKYEKNFCTYCSRNPRSWLDKDHVFDYVFYSNISTQASSLWASEFQLNLKGSKDFPLSDHYGIKTQLNSLPWVLSYDEEYLEARRIYALKLLVQAERLISKESTEEYRYYFKLVRSLRSQLEHKRGIYFEYFNSFR